RARRRAAELGMDVETVLAEQTIRDERDRGREHSPLTQAPDAVVLDTTEMPFQKVIASVVRLAREKVGREVDTGRASN
ncbi:MAG TPA: (d)CMP kinase, partial [Solirubrobacteraceae bacterium]|nr:(d)CMP kinase [Solirubrobacteraceae bacterium]